MEATLKLLFRASLNLLALHGLNVDTTPQYIANLRVWRKLLDEGTAGPSSVHTKPAHLLFGVQTNLGDKGPCLVSSGQMAFHPATQIAAAKMPRYASRKLLHQIIL